jgi:uncharacterized protein YcbK (DUF882 family)
LFGQDTGEVIYEHYSEIDGWDWQPYFSPAEIACKGTNSLLVNPEALDTLLRARLLADKPFHILSAYRSPVHNAFIGGAPLSAHKNGSAFDINLRGHNRDKLLEQCRDAGFGSFGKYRTFLHVDTRKGRNWGSWEY